VRLSIRSLVLVALAVFAAGTARADADARLKDRLDPETAAAVTSILTGAHAAGLPEDPLVAKALEGASKKAPGPRIVIAVRQLADALAGARDALGKDSRKDEIVVGAGALLAGIPADSLAGLRRALPGRSLVVPLVVMADLLARRVPAPAASGAILAASRAGVRDGDLLKLRERVEEDIRAGTPPQAAMTTRGRALLRSWEAMPRPTPVHRSTP
jgi:hypothetical protein